MTRTIDVRGARSLLFVPGNRPERHGKALASGADVVIVDLEDSVGAEGKDIARENAARTAEAHPIVVRVNPRGTTWFSADVEALRPVRSRVVVMLPKCSGAEDVDAVAEAMGAPVWVVPLIESAQGVLALPELASCPSVQRLALGPVDLARDLGLIDEPIDDSALLMARSSLVLHSRAAGLPAPIDGPDLEIDAADFIVESASRSRRLGMSGKLCIHPRQVAWVHEGLSPSASALARARRIVEQSASGDGAVSLDGAMVDAPVVQRAWLILEAASREAGRSLPE
jgi:citrate lyase subunit beta/citryl-CoA lyase